MCDDTHDEVADFDHLTLDVVLHQVEESLGIRCSNICRPLNSYINRVYEILPEEGEPIIAKFYRPGRWSLEALQDEHDFLQELAADEIPVIAPLADSDGNTVYETDGTYFAVFPKKGGRICDEPTTEQWLELGRLLARMHVVGSGKQPRDRVTITPNDVGLDQLETILASGLVSAEHRGAYEQVSRKILENIAPLFQQSESIRIHGDLHHQNLIYRPGESFYLIDFDDMALGPPVQDMWMLLPGRLQDAPAEAGLLLEGYATFRSLDRSSLRLIEPLRAMRYIHFTAWCIRQAADGGFSRLAPDWGSSSYWRQEIQELEKQAVEIEDALAGDLPTL